jgi:hypothetical protein
MKRFAPPLLVTLLLTISSINFVFAQNHATTIKVQAMDMAKALIKNDFATFSKYLPPAIIEYAGGKQMMKSKMDSASEAMKQFGASIKKILIGNPGEIIEYKNQLQSVLPQTTTIETMLGEVTAETSLIAISADNGKNWQFVDTNIYRVDKLKNVLPDLSPQLVIPPRKKPEFKPTTDKQGSVIFH